VTEGTTSGVSGRVLVGGQASYCVGEPIGEGGAAVVYAASLLNGATDEVYAVKIMKLEAAADPELRARFEREVRVLGKLDHGGVCALLDLGTVDGVPFFVQERLRGETLLGRIRRLGPIPVEPALEFLDRILEILGAVHDTGIVHRDIKPSNLFCCENGRVVLLDFGIALDAEYAGGSGARARTEPGGDSLFSEDEDIDRLTQPGALIGTPAFMAPEQARGLFDEVDGTSDVFAATLTVLSAVHGQRIRRAGPSWRELQDAATVPLPPLEDLALPISRDVLRVLARGVAFEHGRRFPTARSMQRALRAARGLPERDAPAPMQRSNDGDATQQIQALSSASLPSDFERPSAFDGLIVSAASAPILERFDAPDEAATIELQAAPAFANSTALAETDLAGDGGHPSRGSRSRPPAPVTAPNHSADGSRRAVVLAWLIAAGIVVAVLVRMALR